MQSFTEIYYLRAFAIIFVLISHARLTFLNGYILPQLSSSWTGVDLFFVISGFVVSSSLVAKLQHAEKYAQNELSMLKVSFFYVVRRLTRILPPALVWAFIPLLLVHYFNDSGYMGSIDNVEGEVKAIVLFYYNYFTANTGLGILNHFWSLAVEEHYYVFLPIFFLIVKRKNNRITCLLTLLALVVINRMYQFHFNFESTLEFSFKTQFRIDGIILGTVLALNKDKLTNVLNSYLTQQHIGSRSLQILSYSLLFFLAFMPGVLEHEQLIQFGYFMFALISLVLVTMAMLDKNFIHIPQRIKSLFMRIGQRSYSLYLCHFPIMLILMEVRYRLWGIKGHWPNLEYAFFSIIVFVILLWGISEATYRLLEQPSLFLSKKITSNLDRVE